MSRAMKAVPLVVLCALIVAVPSVWANWVQDGTAICTATGTQAGPSVVSDGAGGAIFTWQDQRSGNYDVYAQRVNASGTVQWTADGVALCTATGYQQSPQIIFDGGGGAIVTWYDYRSGVSHIYAQRVNTSGAVQWAADGVALCTATGGQGNPTIVSDGAGGAIVTWQDYRSGSNYDIYIYAQRVNAAGVIQWTTDGVALCTAPGYKEYPVITSDGGGGAIVTWRDGRLLWEVYAQRVSVSGVVQWAENGVDMSTAWAYKGAPKIIPDGTGGAIVTWQDWRGICAQRVNASGAVQWAAEGIALCTATEEQTTPTINSDGTGGAIVTWQDWRGIYAQRVNTSGAVQWAADGVALCTATGGQGNPTITSDCWGGAIVTWYDLRSGSSWDIYAQRVNASGSVQWTANGVALSTATGDQKYPTITSDCWGGAIVTWNDYRSGDTSDIYAMRVDANGFPVLTATDAPAVPIELQQNYPNPFNPTTTMTYSVPERCNVALKIYDVSGKCVARLVEKEQEKGSYTVAWNGKDETGNSMASGIYLYRLSAGNQTIARKMVLLR